MKLLIVFLIVIAISFINMTIYSQEAESDTEVAEEMTEVEIEAEINEMVEEELEITEIDIPKDTLVRIKMAQSNIDRWYKTLEIVEYKQRIAKSDLNLANLEMKRLMGVKRVEFKIFLMSTDVCDIEYDEVGDWELKGNRAVKK